MQPRARAHYLRNKPYYRLRNKVQLKRMRLFLTEQKKEPCVDCRRKYPSYVMQFDHVRGRKSANVSTLVYYGSPARILEEIAKCDLVCANCHAERTHQRRL